MARRRDARRFAVHLLYQADVGGRSPVDILTERTQMGERVPRFAEELVRGVDEHLAVIDEAISRASQEWTIDRMAVVDRAILRLGTHELLHRDDVPAGAAIDEAVEAAKELSTEDSGGFVNGILGRIARDHAEAG